MAAAGAPFRFIQEWIGHGNAQTTEIYADYAPDPPQGAKFAESASGTGVGSDASGEGSEQVGSDPIEGPELGPTA